MKVSLKSICINNETNYSVIPTLLRVTKELIIFEKHSKVCERNFTQNEVEVTEEICPSFAPQNGLFLNKVNEIDKSSECSNLSAVKENQSELIFNDGDIASRKIIRYCL